MRRWRTASVDETRALGSRLAAELAPEGVLLLTGDLGSGKTVLAQGVAAGMGIDAREVQSPSFTIVREHRVGEALLVHVDLYRLDEREIEALAIEELLAGPGVKVVEWAERLPFPVDGALWLAIGRHAASATDREIRETRKTTAGRRVSGSRKGD